MLARIADDQGRVQTIGGGMLVQTRDTHRIKREELKVVSKRAPTEKEIDDLLFAWLFAAHKVERDCLCGELAKQSGWGGANVARRFSEDWSIARATSASRISRASDRSFPFATASTKQRSKGLTAIIQPRVICATKKRSRAANDMIWAMVFTGVRHFKH